jgi:STAS-like domain of unknown function (DUF4325)
MQYLLATHGLVFSTRDRGARMRAEVLQAISVAPTETVTLDFADVRSASNSFLDEFIGKLVHSMHPAAPVLTNVPPMIAKTIERSLRRRGLDADRILSESLAAA